MINVNQLELTDDELSLIVTSLITTLAGYEGYVKHHGKESLDCETLEAIDDMTTLYKKLDSKYF